MIPNTIGIETKAELATYAVEGFDLPKTSCFHPDLASDTLGYDPSASEEFADALEQVRWVCVVAPNQGRYV